ncbi:MAG: ROK family protein [Anaerolineaceae bacterium]|nr:ROK family protein [Anaerolineaceae bacterium]
MTQKRYAGIEGGGTKFVCAIVDQDNQVLSEMRCPTTDPHTTLSACAEFLEEQQRALGPFESLGIACFGPLDPTPGSPTYGNILPTPKPGWSGADVLGFFSRRLNLPIGFDTDVNGAALAESLWGAGQGLTDLVYFTIGTGIGGGAIVGGKLLHGLLHPEMGHIPLPRDPEQDSFPGACPFHSDCFEGLAAGPALEKRWGQRAETFTPDHPAWELEAHYIALAMQSIICVLSPQRIILGGGVSSQPRLLPLVRQKTIAYLNGYVQSPAILEHMDKYIVPPGLGTRSGVLGAVALGRLALEVAL